MKYKILHISDSHNIYYPEISECDILIHSGDIGGRTTLKELEDFCKWFEVQPADKKIFIGGNHDICLEKQIEESMEIINKFDIKYLYNSDYVYKGLKIYGSPYSPTFGYNWAFNRNRGNDIKQEWKKIPKDTDILITHGPVFDILDKVNYESVGCNDLKEIIRDNLIDLKLHCSGHIHDQYGVVNKEIRKRNILFSNGAVIDNNYDPQITNPLTITITK